MAAFFTGAPIVVSKIHFSVLNSVEREDGSNRRYNVTGINHAGQAATVFVEVTP